MNTQEQVIIKEGDFAGILSASGEAQNGNSTPRTQKQDCTTAENLNDRIPSKTTPSPSGFGHYRMKHSDNSYSIVADLEGAITETFQPSSDVVTLQRQNRQLRARIVDLMQQVGQVQRENTSGIDMALDENSDQKALAGSINAPEQDSDRFQSPFSGVAADTKVPIRSRKCMHNEVFDAVALLSTRPSLGTWKCPLCANIMNVLDVEIHAVLFEMMLSYPDHDRCVVRPNGTIEVFEDGLRESVEDIFDINQAEETDEN
ncbi:hypothetical protein M427DRAFT_49449 [Gonapodya prolifera JEL478]|uniref:SP-RING-type domain-containing protein n=1 Tax=Gonapodya prolifera (strain JEL478) TaxID=1344416 RepID=A0A138ZYC8_GONPJ|nr:hypothetical protein M427DRAFT_49449 [Gonapodya prolifera JEL478]|eukprot:KXS09471.1 hypothetical protein M427DRAFT_49449 [Gonapodya prolifera JEL478]